MVRYEPARGLATAVDGAEPAPDVVPPWDEVVARLQQTGQARVPGLGTFLVQRSKPRFGRNPGTGEPMRIPASATVVFRVGKALKDGLAEDTPLRIGLAGLDDPHGAAGPAFLQFLVRWQASDLGLPDAATHADHGELATALEGIAAHAEAKGQAAMARAARRLAGLDLTDAAACEPVLAAELRALHAQHAPKTVQIRIEHAVAAAAERIAVLDGAEPAFHYSVGDAIEFPEDRDGRILDALLAGIVARAVPALVGDPSTETLLDRARTQAADRDPYAALETLTAFFTARGRPTDADAADAARRLGAEAGSYDEQRWMVETYVPLVFRSLGRAAVLSFAAEAEDAAVAGIAEPPGGPTA
ncbi:MAG: HU family DNA-binding protein [Alphaproteobacteria bacterium]|nr:HU family DNA-binding protein [Alphaproteobacteria bacterium]